MSEVFKPIYGEIWANAGEVLSPGNDKIATGWIQEMMPYQYENFLQNRTDLAISYLFQKGVPEWSSDQEYIANKSVVTYGSQLYMALLTNTNTLPTITASWKRLTISLGVNGTVPVSFGGTGATNAAEARTNLGVGTIATANFPVSNGLVVKLSDNSLVSRTLTGTTGYVTVTNADGVAGNPVVNIGANVAKTDADVSWTTTSSIKLPSGSTSERGLAVAGRIRFNLELGAFEGFNGTDWTSLGDGSGIIVPQTILTNGIQSSFTLNYTPPSKNNLLIYNNGVYQEKSSYSVTGTSLVFAEAPTEGNLEIVPVTAAPVASVGTWSPQSPIADAVLGTEITTINSILAVMRVAGLILN